ncbi:MAG: GTPase domain-containing protein, partial [Pseudomonadota bacterium]
MAQYAQTGRAFLNRITDTWARLMEPNNAAVPDADIVETAIAQAPVVWILGKVQSGKTSIIKALTNCSDAEVGTGFSPCTRTARMFDFPANVPLLRFLDTRGLGEAHYDAVEDIAFCESRAHLLIVTMRAFDPQQRSVVDVVAQVRARHPDWPVIVAQTCLHEGMPKTGRLPMPYPFAEGAFEKSGSLDVVSLDLRRSLTYQRSLFQDVKGTGAIHFIPIDFTQPEDGIAPSDYGRDALFEAIASAAPDALVATLKSLQTAAVDVGAGRLRSQIIGHASVAAAVDVMPLAGAIAVPAVQAKLLKVLGEHYGVGWDRRSLSEFAGCLGVGIVSRLLASLG